MLGTSEYYGQPLPLAPVASSYMCQTSPPQTSVQPAIGFSTFVPQPSPHDIPLIKTQIIQSAFSPSPPANVIRLPLPEKYMRTLQNPLEEYNKDGIVTTCSRCGQTNTLWDLKIKEMLATLKEYHELNCYLQKQIQFHPFLEEEHPMAVVNSISYTQSMDLPKISNLRANANEFTPAQKTIAKVPNSNECDSHQPLSDTVESNLVESGINSGLHNSGVSDSGNQDSVITNSSNAVYSHNDALKNIQDLNISSESLKTDGSGPQRSNKKQVKKKQSKEKTNEYEPKKPVDNNQNYQYSDETIVGRSPNPPPSRYSRDSSRKTGGSNGYYEPNRSLVKPAENRKGNHENKFRRTDHYDHRYENHNRGQKPYRNNSNGGYDKPVQTVQKMKSVVQEVEGDLFLTNPDCSLVHCVAEDFRMGAGIAVQFRKQFGGVGYLLDQGKKVGEVAYQKKNNRYIFYLVTKTSSSGKPVLRVLERCLNELRHLCSKLQVTRLAMPRIGCGLDRLDWDEVKRLLNTEFCNTNIEITVYYLKEENIVSRDASALGSASVTGSVVKHRNQTRVREVNYPLQDIASKTALVVYGAIDGTVDKISEQLQKKYPFTEKFAKLCKEQPRSGGELLTIEVRSEYVCVLIVKDKQSSPLGFKNLEDSISELNKFLKKKKYFYVGISKISEKDDPLINDKIISVFRNVLTPAADLYVCPTLK